MFATPVARAQAKAGASSTSHQKQETGLASQTAREAAPSPSRDFSKTSGFLSGPANKLQTGAAPSAPRPPGVVQPTLVVGQANDPLEHEADRVADHVMAMSPQIDVGHANPSIQPFSSSSASEALANVDNALAGPGTALHPTLQQDMERRFGHDFSRVRIYADSEAGQSAVDMNAQAYTVGQKVAFAPGRFAPGTAHGLRLLSHELTHVVQQSGGSRGAGVRARHTRCSGSLIMTSSSHGRWPRS